MSEDPSKLRRVGGFELLHEIGEGGMGTVWKARQISLDRIVALKLLSPEFSQSSEFIGRFRNEARAAALLTHRHIVQVYDAGKADDTNYLAMEFIEGKSVHALVQARGKMSETEALDIVLPVAMALRYAFERAQLIHRDVKPENILIDRDGVVKLCDLGLAKIVTGPESLKLTRSGMTLGTPFYISPEQAEGRDLDARSDVYSLGATLYHMVTGHAPFEDASTAIAMMKQVKETVPDARQFQPQLSPTICMVIEKMMAKDRRDRYQNWAEVISDLQLVRIGRHPVNARLSPNRSTMQRRENIAPGPAARVAESAPVIVLETKGLVMTPLMWAGVALIVFCLLGSGVLFVLSEERETALRAELKNKMTAARGDAAARSYYEAVEFARTHPLDCDEITNRFTRVLHTFRDTSFAEQAANQVAEWEKRCIEVRKQRARQETATRNALAADARRKAEARTKAEKAEMERKAAQAAREAEEKRRATEEAARARQTALAAYHEFCPAWQALLARRDYPGALLAAQAAVSNPNLAPQKQLLTTHVAATERIRAFITRLLAPDSPLRGKTVALSRITGTITAVTAGRSVTIEKMAGVAASMPLLMLPPDDFLKLAAVGLKADNTEDQITGALLALAEGRVAPATAALQNVASPTADPFKQMMAGIAEAQAEREAVATLGDLRTQLEARQWPFAFAKLTALDTRYTNTLAFAAASSELAEARDRLLAAPAAAATAEAAAHLAITETGRAAEARNWKRALTIFTALDAQLNDAATVEALTPATVTDIGTMRRRLILESGMPEAAVLGDIARRRAIAKAGGYVWTVKAEGGNAASLQDALTKADDGDAIEVDGGTHVVSKFDGAAKPNLVIYGRGGTLPILTDATVGGTNTVGGYILACGDDWQLENLHFQFSTAALYQRGTNLVVRGCAFTRSYDPRRSGYAVYASCNADWRLSLSNCLVAAPDSEVLVATPYRDTAPRYNVEMNHCTLWTLVGTVFSTSQRTLERHFTLNLRNSVVVAQRVASAVWTRDLMRSSLTYTGDRNLAYVVRYADETPTLGDENWKELFPGQDSASLITPVTYASLTALRRGRHAPTMRDFVSPSQGDLRLTSDSAGLTLADDGTEAGVRWPAWRWEQYLKNASETTPSELAESGTVLAALVPPVLTESQRVQAAGIPLGSLFQGAVQELPDGRIELKYDFANTNQMADWRVIRPASATGTVAALPSFTITSNAVRKSVLDLSLLAHRARFKGDVVLQFNATVEKGAVVAGVLSFPNERLAAVADLSSGLRIVSREVGGSFDVITNLSVKASVLRSFPLIVGTEGSKLIESVPDIGMLEATLPRVRAVCEVALAADRALARFSQVRLTGTLDTNWVAIARAVTLLGPDILATNTTAALPTVTATNVATLSTTNAPTFASLTQAQQLKASQLPITALFKGDLKELGGDKYEWTYDLSKPEHRADWEIETPAVWVTDGGPMSRRPGVGKPLWFRARLRGNFTVSCRVQTTGSGTFQLTLRYGSGEDASWIAAGLGTFSGGTSDGTTLSGFGIGKRSATSRVMAELNRHPYSLSGSRATLAFYCSQTSDLLRAQLHRRDTDKSPVRAETHLTRADVPFTLGFDGDSTSQYEVSEIHITGSPDLEWIRAEQARVLVQSGK